MIVHYDKETDNLLRKKKLSKGKETATRSANSRSDGRGPSVEILVENLNFQGSKASFWYYDFSHWAHGRAHNLYDGDTLIACDPKQLIASQQEINRLRSKVADVARLQQQLKRKEQREPSP
ncbi:uncharacterized protein HKW66_Vig0218830 [Vigna angularis]|uniref:Uncharacterized protein n=1 Tax=Phaseolus angularis TaxID=3914 RepID=A0A8T0JEX1_PHAAN|nr:uncharacterized protein HKW66_Vig0218830 [Vigna angularis]